MTYFQRVIFERVVLVCVQTLLPIMRTCPRTVSSKHFATDPPLGMRDVHQSSQEAAGVGSENVQLLINDTPRAVHDDKQEICKLFVYSCLDECARSNGVHVRVNAIGRWG
jgi:hypothetical protein